jgi:cytochrome c peroxidase
VQSREPAALVRLPVTRDVDAAGESTITLGAPEVHPLGGPSVADTGHKLFHEAASQSTGLACASCHPEGHEDGRTWKFDLIGARRTQELGNNVLETAPLHWDGDMTDLGTIMSEVFVHRMGGAPQGPRHVDAFSGWMSKLPKVRVSATTASVKSIEHGKELFDDATVGCATCHSGTHFTNNLSMDVGTGKVFQVPTLVSISARAPFMHDGCAATLKDRFGACGGSERHGHTAHLSDTQRAALVAYLTTL